jgi:hypothetical protein
MDVATEQTIRLLEAQNHSKAEELVRAYQRISDLESTVDELSGTDSTYVGPETQIDFIRKVAGSRTKFANEAQDIIDGLDSGNTDENE